MTQLCIYLYQIDKKFNLLCFWLMVNQLQLLKACIQGFKSKF